MSSKPPAIETDAPAASSGITASIAVSMVLHVALLGTFAAVGGFDSAPIAAETVLESTWHDGGDSAGPMTVLSDPVAPGSLSSIAGLDDSLSKLNTADAPAFDITPGGGQGLGLPGRAMANSDLKSALGRGKNGKGTGAGEGTGNGGGSAGGRGFFGRGSAGEKVVYVVDSSQSMNHPHPGPGKNRLGRVKLELINSVRALQPNQKFFIVFFNENAIPMPADRLIEANEASKLQYLRWMVDVPADGHTDPAMALLLALRLNPDTIYFLTDGDFRPTIVREVAVSNRKGVKIHTIGFTHDRGENLLRAIAKQNGGTYTYVPPDEEGPPEETPPAATTAATPAAPMP